MQVARDILGLFCLWISIGIFLWAMCKWAVAEWSERETIVPLILALVIELSGVYLLRT